MDQRTIKLDTIRNTYQRLRSDGYMISEASLRGWVRRGKIRHIPQGGLSYGIHQKTRQQLSDYCQQRQR